MPRFGDALRGSAFPTHKRHGFKCVSCGLDGTQSFTAWLSLSWEHLLPKGDPRRDDRAYIVTACMFCNLADNHYFRHAAKRGITFEGKTPDELVVQGRPYVMETREDYRRIYETDVRPGWLDPYR